MHNTHGCYAKSSLIKSRRHAYLAVTRKKTIGTQKDTKMNITRSFAEWRRYRATCNELNRLTSRELNDLGISRGDIPFVARKAARA